MRSSLTLEFGPLVKARFVERPNRFVVQCKLEHSEEMVTAHLADPGRLKELLVPGALLYLRRAQSKTRKTKWSVILVQAQGSVLVSLQSTLVNHLAAAALQEKAVAALAQWDLVRAEFAHGNSRFDFLLASAKGEKLLLEVKSCTLVNEGMAMFPDAVTARGARHLKELAQHQFGGIYRGAVMFVVQRSDAQAFRPAAHIDPHFAEALSIASRSGVQVLAYNCRVDETGITWGQKLPVHLG